MDITYLTGDATDPILPPNQQGVRFIAHICNDIGAWGAGFVIALSQRWGVTGRAYRIWSQNLGNYPEPFKLGEIQVVTVNLATEIKVVNMVAQHGVGYNTETGPPIRYDALVQCLIKLNIAAHLYPNSSIHMPRIGSGLAGGHWDIIEQIIKKHITIPVYVYDLPTS